MNGTKYQIGEFSYISRFSVKALRFYHDQKILEPSYIDGETGYRFYDDNSLGRARIIQQLKNLDFTIREIKEIISSCSNDTELVAFVEEKYRDLESKIRKYESIQNRLKQIIDQSARETDLESKLKGMTLETKTVPAMHITSIRFQGRYSDFGTVMHALFKNAGRGLKGAPFSLYWEIEYKEIADIEICVPSSSPADSREIEIPASDGDENRIIRGILSSRTIKEVPVISTIHKGPYTTLGDGYSVLFSYCTQKGLQWTLPIREFYKKGPGMIFQGNPENFLTEIQVVIDPDPGR